MGVTVYAYQVEEEGGEIMGYASSVEEVADELRRVRAEIRTEDGYEPTRSAIWAFDMFRPEIEQLFAVLNRDAELSDILLSNKRVVRMIED